MKQYQLEAEQPTLTAKVLCGAKKGYEGDVTFSKDEILSTLDGINQQRVRSGQRTIACIVTEGTLLGRATQSAYREEVYNLDFTWSARVEQIPPKEFYADVCEYVEAIGIKLGQERMYVQFQGRTSVYKRNEKE